MIKTSNKPISRRLWLGGLIGLMGTGLGLSVGAETKTMTLKLDQVFPFYKVYLELPEQERSLYRLVFPVKVKKANPTDVSLVMNHAGKTIPLNYRSGYLSPLPRLEHYKAKSTITLNAPKESSLSIGLSVVPMDAPQKTIDADRLKASITQANKGAKKAAGVFGMAIPTFDRIRIKGVKSGTVLLANGDQVPLPYQAAKTEKNGYQHAEQVIFVPDQWPNARSISFLTVPDEIEIDSK